MARWRGKTVIQSLKTSRSMEWQQQGRVAGGKLWWPEMQKRKKEKLFLKYWRAKNLSLLDRSSILMKWDVHCHYKSKFSLVPDMLLYCFFILFFIYFCFFSLLDKCSNLLSFRLSVQKQKILVALLSWAIWLLIFLNLSLSRLPHGLPFQS